MKGIDFKSLVVGLAVGVCLVLALGAGGGGVGDVDRYQVAAVHNSSTCFVIDSTTGRTWLRRSSASGSYLGSPEEWDKK